MFVFKQQQNLGQKFGASKIHLRLPVASAGGGSAVVYSLFIDAPIVCWGCVWHLFCYAVLSVF